MAFQLGSALLDACVLSVIAKDDVYGYLITQQVQELFPVSESTLYPVLRRLQKDGCLTTYDQAFQGRNRRYYAITEAGKEKLAEHRQEWLTYRANVDHILLGVEA